MILSHKSLIVEILTTGQCCTTLESTLNPTNSIQIGFSIKKAVSSSQIPEDLRLALADGTWCLYILLHYAHYECASVCPGKDLAETHLWITIASMFYAFKITPAVDESGKEIPIDLDFSEHSIRQVPPHKVDNVLSSVFAGIPSHSSASSNQGGLTRPV